MKPISTSTYTFEKLRGAGCVYVDKTELIYRLVASPSGQFFCARPRRFGKSLTVSTLEAIFRSRRELFEGLWIAGADYDWCAYPVVHIDFARASLMSVEILSDWITSTLGSIAAEYGVSLASTAPDLLFGELIKALHDKCGKGVVLLVDEYDRPVQEHIDRPELAEEFRRLMESFYQMIKGYEPYLRFVFLTGVARFAKLSVFSKLNNLDDISMDEDYACLMGYTQDELEESFSEYLDDAVRAGARSWEGEPLDRAGLLAEVARFYDGFTFAPGCQSLYNPVSVGRFFSKHYHFDNYWFATGTPSFLVRLLKQNGLTLVDVAGATMSADSIGTFDLSQLTDDVVEDQRIVQLLFQTGYLTLGERVTGLPGRMFEVRFPNKEVEDSFEQYLFSASMEGVDTFGYAARAMRAARSGDTGRLIETLRGLLAGAPYPIKSDIEEYWQSMVYMALRTCGMDVQQEVTTSIGRIDAVMRAGQHLYLFEFKLDGSADEALAQIDERRYADRYLVEAHDKGWTIHKVGVNFSWADGVRNIYDWREE